MTRFSDPYEYDEIATESEARVPRQRSAPGGTPGAAEGFLECLPALDLRLREVATAIAPVRQHA